ncbi:putative ribonuclease H-like domain-containing protein [Tanacetum coccineum]
MVFQGFSNTINSTVRMYFSDKDVQTSNCEEKEKYRRNDVRFQGLLLMALPNEHQLTFSQYPDAKSMFAAIETRFGGNAATKKTQKDSLKQTYEISGHQVERSLDLSFNRIQTKILPHEWNYSVVSRLIIVWMNKPEIETMSIDDLYNNFKIVEQKVKKYVGASSGAQNLAFMTALEHCSYNDLEQIHEDNLEAIDLKWQLSLLSVRANKYYQRTGKKIFINANDIAGYDKSKVEYYKLGHSGTFCLGVQAPSDMAEEQVQTNMALMAFSDSEVYTDKTCSKTCLKNYETLKKQCDDLLVKLNESEFKAATYKRVLKREVACKNYEINVLKSELEKVKQEKDGIDFKIEKFDKASKDLDQLLGSQITDKSKKGLGYSAVPPPHPLIYNRPNKLDLSYSGLDEFKEPEFKGYGPEKSKQESNVVCDKESENSKENSDESLVEEQVSQDKSGFVESSPNVDKETVFPVNKKVEFTKPENHEKPVKKSVRYAEMYRSQSPRGNQRNWNGQKSNQLGKDFVMYNKACYICGSFNHLQINCHNHQRRGIVSRNNYNRMDAKNTHPSVLRNMSPKAVLLKTGLTPLNTVRPVNTAHPKIAVHSAKSKTHFSKQAQSTAKRPIYKQTTLTRRSVHTAKRHYYTGRYNAVNTARSYTGQVNVVRGKPQHDDKGFVDSGCSRHMTGNIAYLSDFKEFDGGYVAFGGGAYGGTSEENKPNTADDAQKQVEDGPNNENAEQERFADDSSTKDVNAVGQHINTVSPDVNTSSLKLNIKPTSIAKALSDSSWVEAMQEELLQFKLQQVWILVDLPNGKNAIGTKWVFRNKKDEKGIVIRNKARLVAQGHRQEEGIDYEEEEVYVTQPPGFKDSDHPNKVYKVYVDDIIFGSTNKELCTGFEKLMKDKFQMSSLKFNYSDVKSASTPVDLEKPLVKDEDVNDVDIHLYRSMIGSLMYITASRKISCLQYVHCKKQTVVATSTTEAEYVAAASCCRQETNSGLVLKLKGSKQSHIKVHFKGIIAKVQYQRFKYQRDHSKGSISKVQISKGS